MSGTPPPAAVDSNDTLSLAVPVLDAAQQRMSVRGHAPAAAAQEPHHKAMAVGNAANHQDAAAVIQQLLNVEEVEMLHRIFEMEGLIPVMMSASSGVGGTAGGSSSSAGLASSAAQQGASDASASGSLCLTMPHFIEALVYVCTMAQKKMPDDNNHSKASSSTTSAAAVAASAPIAMDRAKLYADATTWTMQLVTQVEGVRVRKNRSVGQAHVTTASSTFFGGVPSPGGSPGCGLMSRETQQSGAPSLPTSPMGKLGGGRHESATPLHHRGGSVGEINITDLSTLFPADRAFSFGATSSAVPGAPTSGGAPFAPDQPKLVVKWSEFTSSFIRDAEHKDAVEDQSSDMHRLAKHMVRCSATQLHTLCPSLSLLTTRGDAKKLLVTGGSDGLVKVWSAATNGFESTFSNNGSAWVVGMAFLQNENYIMIATSNGQLTVHEFPGGNVVQKYIGCVSLISAISEVNVLSVLHTRKFGMLPGESGPRQVRFTNVQDLSQEAFSEKRRLARGGPLNRSVPVKPVVGGFVNPTTLEYLPERNLCFFGTVDGTVGCFDISEDLRQATLITGSAVKSIHVLFSAPGAHLDAVTCIRYASKLSVLLTAGMDGCIYKISMEGLGTKWMAHAIPQRHNTHETQSRPIIGMEWSEPLQLLVSYASDRVLKFWSLMRSEPLHVMEALPHDVRSACFLGTERIAVLTSDKSVYVFDLKSFRMLQVITQSVTGENSGGALDVSSATIIRSMGDPGGCLRYDCERETLTCCLRSPVQYAAAAFGGNSAATAAAAVAAAADPSSSEGDNNQTPHRTLSIGGGNSPQATHGGRSPRAGTARHPQGVVDMTVQRHTRTLFSIDEQNLFMWDLASGQCTSWASVARQVRKASSCPPHLQDRPFVLTRCGWAGAEAIRLVTGTQAGCVLTWTPTGTGILAVEGFTSSSLLGDVACCVSSGAHLLVCVGNKAHLITYDTSMVMADGNRRSTVRTITLEGSGGSIASARFLRDAALVAVGTVDAAIHFCNFETMATPDTLHLKDRNGNDEVSSVEEIILLQRRKQNLALLLLEDGAINVFSIGKRCIVFHARLFRKHEARFQAACVSVQEERLYVADSIGRIYAFDIGRMAATTDFRSNDASVSSSWVRYLYHFQASVDGGVSCLACFEVAGSSSSSSSSSSSPGLDGLAAGCHDGSIRCFAASKDEAVHAGTLGDGNPWDWLDPSTYAREVLPAVEKYRVDASAEQFLDDILREAKHHHRSWGQHDDGDAGEDTAEEVATGAAAVAHRHHAVNLPVMMPPSSTAEPHKSSPRIVAPVTGAEALPSTSPRRAQQQPHQPQAPSLAVPAAAATSSQTADDLPLMIEQSPSSRVADDACSLPLLILPNASQGAAAATTSGGAGPFSPPKHHMPTSCNAQDAPAHRKMLVKKRFIKPPDIDLGNGLHIADHATEIILQAARESFRRRKGGRQEQCSNDNGRRSPICMSPNRAVSPTDVGGRAGGLVVAPSSSAVAVACGNGSNPQPQSATATTTSENAADFFLTSVGSSGQPLPAGDADTVPRHSMSDGGGGPLSVDETLSGSSGGGAAPMLLSPRHGNLHSMTTAAAPTTRHNSVTTRCIGEPSYANSSSEAQGGPEEESSRGLERSANEESSARVHTRALLRQMAHRLDMVRPNGSNENRFQKHVERLYESEEQRRERHVRKRARREARRDSAAHLAPVQSGEGLSAEGSGDAGGAGERSLPPDEDEDDDEDDDGEDILASLRSPQTVKNVESLEEKLRQYRKVREMGAMVPPPPSSPSLGGTGASAGGAGNGSASSPRRTNTSSLPPRDPQWMTRVSSQLYMQDVTFTVPSTVAVTPQRSAKWVQVSGGAGIGSGRSAGGAGGAASYQQTNAPSLQRGMSLFAPAPPSSAPGTSRGGHYMASSSMGSTTPRQRVPTAPKTAR